MQPPSTPYESVTDRILQLKETSAHSIAVQDGARTLSYGELWLRANRFAGYLTQLGVTPGATVAICLERSSDWIIAALGILSAGAAYVPLDLSWPDARLRFAIVDSGASALVAPATVLARLQVKAQGIDPLRDVAAIAAAPLVEAVPVQPGDLAYMVYTSGSTGTPKGVELTHANLTHLTCWHGDAFHITSRDRVSHLASLGFDAAVWDIWPNLAAGATLCIADDAVRSSPELIQEWLLRERVTVSFVPTIHATALITMNWPATTELRFLLTGGDTLHRGPAFPLPFTVINNYGPTECTVVATSAVVQVGSTEVPPIGLPVTGASIYLLDEKGQLVANGQSGEIFIGGRGVGRGYRNLPDATQQSFLPDPFSRVPGARMYRSGDCGTRRLDGQIEFRGRVDRQVKIRGQRVELDEISSILNRHPAVDFAVVTATVGEDSALQFIAYVMPKEESQLPTVATLQEHLLHTLPSYMIPRLFMRLDRLPLTPNGKLDFAMLPQAAGAPLPRRDTGSSRVSSTGEKVLGVVRQILKNPEISFEDNFFLAGGHSLLGMQLVLRLREATGVALSLRQLFEAPTVEGLTALIDTKLAEERLLAIWTDLLGVKVVSLDADFFDLGGNDRLVQALAERVQQAFGRKLARTDVEQNATVRLQAQLLCGRASEDGGDLPAGVIALQTQGDRSPIFWLHYPCLNLAKALGPGRPFLYTTLADEDLAALGDSPTLQAVAACLVFKIVAAQPTGPYVLGGFCLGGILAFEVAHQMQAAGLEVSMLVLLDSPSPRYYNPAKAASLLRRPGYLSKRLRLLGLRGSLSRLRDRTVRREQAKAEREQVPAYGEPTQVMVETAASHYTPRVYNGAVLLIMASDNSTATVPHGNFLPWWQSLVPRHLQTQYVGGRHLELIEAPIVHEVAESIATHLLRTEQVLA